MRLLTKIFLLSSLLLPTHLLAAELSQGSNNYGMSNGMGKTYLYVSGMIPMVQKYDLTGTKGTGAMDIVKMKRDSGFGFNVATGYTSLDNGLMLELSGGFTTTTDIKESLTTKKGNDGKTALAGHVSKVEYRSWNALVNARYLVALSNEVPSEGSMMSQEMNVSPFVTAGVGFSLLSMKPKEVVEKGTAADKGALLDSAAVTQIKKFDQSDFLLSYKVGGGVEVSMGDSALLIGYHYFGTKDPKNEQTISGTKYSFSRDKNNSHNLEAGIVVYF